jgi:hypothetical protein
MGFSVDKRLKIDKPSGTIYSSSEPHSIKVANTAPSKTMKADEIAIETAKTGKVTGVVPGMRIFSEKRCKLHSANQGNEKPSCPKVERANFPEENARRSRSPPQKSRKGRIPKILAPKLKKLELNCTKLKLNSKKSRSDCAKTPDPSISSRLKVKNKTIGVLLDSESSGDLLFMKKGSSKRISVVKQVIPQSRGTSNGTFVTDKVGNIEISFVECCPTRRSAFSRTLLSKARETKRQCMTS